MIVTNRREKRRKVDIDGIGGLEEVYMPRNNK